MKLSLIVATDENGIIGNSKTNDIPWYLSVDLKRFKQLTTGNPIIMGFNTYTSMRRFPLPNRINIVITSRPRLVNEATQLHSLDLEKNPQPVFTFDTISQALEFCKSIEARETFIIGGARIYADALQNYKVDTIHRTLVKLQSNGDVKFPEINNDNWELTWMQPGKENEIKYIFTRYDRVLAS